MEQGKNHELFQDPWFQSEDHDDKCASSTSTSSIGEESMVSNGSSSISSSDDTADDASSSSSSSSSSNSGGAVYDLTEIMDQLPIKRGLSKFYQGKSESFTSLSRVTSIEDLSKKASPYRRNLKASKSYGAGLNSYKLHTLPKPIITKKTKATRPSSSFFSSKRGTFFSSSKPPLSPTHHNKLE